MRYLLVVCSDGLRASDAEEELAGKELLSHIDGIADIDVYGHPLQGPAEAKTVRVRDRQTLVTDGPFVETREHIAGFDVVDCESRDRAIEAAASHPLAWFHRIEVWPLASDQEEWTAETRQRLQDGPAEGKQRYLMLICSDGIPTDEQRETMHRELPAYVDRLTAAGAHVAGGRLEHADAAVTVRVRGPHTLITDGPFVEAKEFLAGFDVIDCDSFDEAVAVAAAHPVSWFHAIEVRPFSPQSCEQLVQQQADASLAASA